MEHDASPLNGQCKRCGRFTHETGPNCKPEVVEDNSGHRLEPLDSAWEAINALGGTVRNGDAHGAGYVEAVNHALNEIEKIGGMDPLERKRQNREGLT